MSEERDIQEIRGPYKIFHRDVILDEFGMQVNKDQIIHPNGEEGRYNWINFPREAVLIFALDNEKNIYLVEEFTYATDKWLTEVPGGTPQENESFEDAAIRRVKEEVGLEIESLADIGTTHEITSRVNNTTHRYMAKVKSVGEADPRASQAIRLKKVPFDEAYLMVLNQKITTATVTDGSQRIKGLLDALPNLRNLAK